MRVIRISSSNNDMKSAFKFLVAALLTSVALVQLAAAEFPFDTNRLDQITGLKGKLNTEEGVYKVSSPRTDVNITVDNWKMPPFMGLTSWAAFTSGKEKEAMVMGDLVLFQDEVN